ncbi:MAG: Rrf2 family transcriptional regulator [Myxococcales bacterium]|nr:Rrf2 family transcriptional regulator [Myxococcales bacterium]
MTPSTKVRYGLRILIELAVRYGSGPVQAETVAQAQGISAKYIRVLVGHLKNANLVRVSRGPHGGFQLARPPESITALDALKALDGPVFSPPCAQTAIHCLRAGSCAAQALWNEAFAAATSVFSSHTLDELARREREHREVPSYQI